MESKKILFLSQYFWPEEMATSALLSGIAFKISEQGYSVEGLAGQPAYLSKKETLPKVVEKGGVKVRRVWSTQFDKNRTLGRILNAATFTLSTLLGLIFRAQPDVIITVTNPPLLLWVAWLNALLKKAPYIIIIHDVYPDVAVKLGKIKNNSLIDKLWTWLNLQSYRRAEKIIVLGSCMKNVIAGELGDDKKIVIIQNWSDGENIRPILRANHPQLLEWGLQDKFVIQYSGNLGLFHEIQTVLDAALQLKNDDKVVFLFIGEGGQLNHIRNFVDAHQLKNIVIKPYQPYEKLPYTLTACDLALVTLKEEVTGLCVPSKLYGILASGKPVLSVANDSTETSKTVIEHSCGIAVEPGDIDALVNEIKILMNDQQLIVEMGVNARTAFENRFTLEKIASRYVELLKEAI